MARLVAALALMLNTVRAEPPAAFLEPSQTTTIFEAISCLSLSSLSLSDPSGWDDMSLSLERICPPGIQFGLGSGDNSSDLTESVHALERVTASSLVTVCPEFFEPAHLFRRRLCADLNVLDPKVEQQSLLETPIQANADRDAGDVVSAQTLQAALEFPSPHVPAPWVFKGNGARGVKTWLSEAHVLEINPRWLNFAMFDSMNLSITDKSPGPGESGSQQWRSTFTVGLSTDWQCTPAVVLHAGYRFYNNPVPGNITAGAFPNASQHVMAVGMNLREGRHSLALTYGLDLMEPAVSSGISSARQGGNIDPLAHLVCLTYAFTF